MWTHVHCYVIINDVSPLSLSLSLSLITPQVICVIRRKGEKVSDAILCHVM